MKRQLTSKLYYLYWIAIFAGLFLVFTLPFFQNLNFIFSDTLHSADNPRNEIVIIAIDDKSLNKIGSWPWNRANFAKLINELDKAKPAVVSFDVLFFEERSGDTDFKTALEKANFPIILGSKITSATGIKKDLYSAKNTASGFVNFDPASDGKIREQIALKAIKEKCYQSLALQTYLKFIKFENTIDCSASLKIRGKTYALSSNKSLNINYTDNNFKTLSFIDVLDGKYKKEELKDKIIFIGATEIDLKGDFTDAFTGIDGETIPGVFIHANSVDSFLNDSFLASPDTKILYGAIGLLTLVLLYVFKKSQNSIKDVVLIIVVSTLNIFIGIAIFGFNIVLPVISIQILLLTLYTYVTSYKYFTEKRQKRFIQGAFSKYLNKSLLNDLLENPGKLKLGGEKKELTILFSDIRGFTTISESLESTELIDMINKYLSFMSKIIIQNNGLIDKYIGDAIMALWNTPTDNANHAQDGLIAALEMQKSVTEFNNLYPNFPNIAIGIGLNTGDVVVGNVGGADRFDYTALGDQVNLGARLEGLTKYYSCVVIVTEFLKAKIDNAKIGFRFLDEVKVKGKDLPVKIYEPFFKEDKDLHVINKYEQAFALYQQGKFDNAQKILAGIKEKDLPSEKLYERIENMSSELKSNWTGVWSWDTK